MSNFRWHCANSESHTAHGFTGDGYYGPYGYICDGSSVPTRADEVNDLAALIRQVDGAHSLGAGALAEALHARGVRAAS